jgi:hypothetical protein
MRAHIATSRAHTHPRNTHPNYTDHTITLQKAPIHTHNTNTHHTTHTRTHYCDSPRRLSVLYVCPHTIYVHTTHTHTSALTTVHTHAPALTTVTHQNVAQEQDVQALHSPLSYLSCVCVCVCARAGGGMCVCVCVGRLT